LERRGRLHDAVAMGAGAGVAAAFVAPLAGSAYAVEDITARYSSLILGTVSRSL
jgi:H+/Cl- antiporter ClcA